MSDRHFHDHFRHADGLALGPFHRWRKRDRGIGQREGRMFDGGELRLIILALVAEKPRHGYEIIKELGKRVGGDYSPSPGVVYPTLTMLEELGYATPSQDQAGRKLYTLTSEGDRALAENKRQVDAIFDRLVDRAESAEVRGIDSVSRAMINLLAATSLRLRGRAGTQEQIQAIIAVLDEAARTIERI
jgi:DNA-binding PadR family transcriptional regulator